MTRKYRSAGRKSYASTNSSVTNPTWSGVGLNQGLRGDRPANNHKTVTWQTVIFIRDVNFV